MRILGKRIGKYRLESGFGKDELREALERSLGFRIARFEPLKCVNSLNFLAVREGDGFRFSVKCVPDFKKGEFDRLTAILATLKGSRSVQRLFENECPETFHGFRVLCLSWCDGHGMFPDRLSETEFSMFLADYLDFHRALQRAVAAKPKYPIGAWRRELLGRCTGAGGKRLRRMLDEAPEALCEYRDEKLSVIHGDLHPGNFFFHQGRVSGFLDVESITMSYPAWDFVRYFAFALDHLGPFAFSRKRTTYGRFAQAVRELPYSEEDWLVSINASWIEQLMKKVDDRAPSSFAMWQLDQRGSRYRTMRTLVSSSMKSH